LNSDIAGERRARSAIDPWAAAPCLVGGSTRPAGRAAAARWPSSALAAERTAPPSWFARRQRRANCVVSGAGWELCGLVCGVIVAFVCLRLARMIAGEVCAVLCCAVFRPAQAGLPVD